MTLIEFISKITGIDPNKDIDINEPDSKQVENPINDNTPQEKLLGSTDELNINELQKLIEQQTAEIVNLKQANLQLLTKTEVKPEPNVDELILNFGGYRLKEE